MMFHCICEKNKICVLTSEESNMLKCDNNKERIIKSRLLYLFDLGLNVIDAWLL